MPAPFTRVQLAANFPGICIRCSRREDLIDLGADPIRSYGTVHLCTVCVGELADNMGLIRKDIVARQLADRDAEIHRLSGVIATRPTRTDPAYQELLDELADLLDSHRAGSDAAGPALVPVPDAGSGAADADDDADEPALERDSDAGAAVRNADDAAGEGAGSPGADAAGLDPWDVIADDSTAAAAR